jgi:hypothetical protein
LQGFIDFNPAVQAILCIMVLGKAAGSANNSIGWQTNLVRISKYAFNPVIKLKFRTALRTSGLARYRFDTTVLATGFFGF